MILPRSFYARDTVQVAQDLLGMYLIHDTAEQHIAARIVETEAYLGAKDSAAHSFKGKTARTKALFGPPGTWYIYFIYGRYYCSNLVTGDHGAGEAVLLRAVEPITGVVGATNGPARLVQALQIHSSQNGTDATTPPLYVSDSLPEFLAMPQNQYVATEIMTGSRIGITKAAELQLRFWIKDNPFVSRMK